ncbi:MAG: hypothetical protein AAGD34_09340 [Pseudomonadota bacterium]
MKGALHLGHVDAEPIGQGLRGKPAAGGLRQAVQDLHAAAKADVAAAAPYGRVTFGGIAGHVAAGFKGAQKAEGVGGVGVRGRSNFRQAERRRRVHDHAQDLEGSLDRLQGVLLRCHFSYNEIFHN